MSVTIIQGSSEVKNATILYENILETGTVTVSSETSDGAGTNAIEDTTFDFWTGGAASSNIKVDMGSAVECDCIGVAAHTIGTEAATLTVAFSTDDISYTDVAEVSPTDDNTIMIIFPMQNARYWRVTVSDGPASCGVIKIGKRVVFPSGALSGHIAINHSQKVELLAQNISQSGQYLGTRIKRIGASASVNFGLVSVDFVENDLSDFEYHFNSGRTFFYAGSPSEWPNDYGYCWRRRGELRPSYEEGGSLAQVDMEVEAYV